MNQGYNQEEGKDQQVAPVVKVKRKTKTYESGSTGLHNQAVASTYAGTGGSGGSNFGNGSTSLNTQKRKSSKSAQQDDGLQRQRSQPYQMMDINELDEHHIATITRKTSQGLKRESTDLNNNYTSSNGLLFETRQKRNSSGSSSRERKSQSINNPPGLLGGGTISLKKNRHEIKEEGNEGLTASQILLNNGDGQNSQSKNEDAERRKSKSQIIRNSQEFFDQSNFDNFNDGEGSQSRVSIIKGGSRPRSTMRTDRSGTVIQRGKQKSFKISFADNVQNDKAKLSEVYFVESYKKFNLENTHGDTQQGCCSIF